jgi:hypothetical protein
MEKIMKTEIEKTAIELGINEYEILEIFEYKSYNLTGVKEKYLILMEDDTYQGMIFGVDEHAVQVSSLENFNNKLIDYNMDYIEIYSSNLSKFDYYGIIFNLNKSDIIEKFIKELNSAFEDTVLHFEDKTITEIKLELTSLFKDGIFLIDILKNGSITNVNISSNQFFKDINSDFTFNLEVINSKYRQNLNNIILNCKLLSEEKLKENC